MLTERVPEAPEAVISPTTLLTTWSPVLARVRSKSRGAVSLP
ncbi:MAG: hypothetical protein ACK56F_04510 [bacterium]